MNERTKSRFEVIVTSYGGNKNRDDEKTKRRLIIAPAIAERLLKTLKIKVKLPHVNKKPLARKRIFVQTPFSHYFKNRAKNITPQNDSPFRSTS